MAEQLKEYEFKCKGSAPNYSELTAALALVSAHDRVDMKLDGVLRDTIAKHRGRQGDGPFQHVATVALMSPGGNVVLGELIAFDAVDKPEVSRKRPAGAAA